MKTLPLVFRPALGGCWKRYGAGESLRSFDRVADQILHTVAGALLLPAEEAVLVIDLKGMVRIANQRACELFEFLEGNSGEEISAIRQGLVSEERFTALIQGRAAAEHYEVTPLTLKDKQVRLQVFLSPVEDRSGRTLGLILMGRSFSERSVETSEGVEKEAPAQREENRFQLEKLAAVGRFSCGIVHEVKNPLSVILSWAELLERKLSQENDETKAAVQKIKGSALRAQAILQEVLRFARPSHEKMERLSPGDLIAESLGLLKSTGSMSGISPELYLPGKEICIEADKAKLQQVLVNLLTNAVEAMPCGGRLRVGVYRQKAILPPLSREEEVCVIQVGDTGEGIPPENLSRLFEPFFTTKADRKGNGLGLWISRWIVQEYGGDLRICSEPGKGATATLRLPLAGGG